jgi:hypothetical protein
MDLLGVISAERDPPGIDRPQWQALIVEHAALTREDAAGDSACVVVDGSQVGRIAWSQSDANEIDVYGELEHVRELARQVAVALGGHFVTLEELISC